MSPERVEGPGGKDFGIINHLNLHKLSLVERNIIRSILVTIMSLMIHMKKSEQIHESLSNVMVWFVGMLDHTFSAQPKVHAKNIW